MQSEAGYHFTSNYLSCQQKFYWRYIVGLEPVRISSSLVFGDAIHKALADYYEKKADPSMAVERFNEEVTGKLDDDQITRGRLLLIAYFEHYVNDPMLLSHLQVETPKQLKLKSGRVITGNIDLIEGGRVIIDHKTTGWSLDSTIQSLRMSNQATVYLALCPECQYVIYNILYSNKSVIKFHREIVFKSPFEIETYIAQMDAVLEEITAKAQNPKALWWRNDAHCLSYNSLCPYIELCKGGRLDELMKTNFKIKEQK